jgi:transcriptional regulator with XRE-family HTH domain
MIERNAKLEAARRLRGWTLEVASQKIGVHPQTLRNWEKGRSKPHGFRICRISEIYEATPTALGLEWEYEYPPPPFARQADFAVSERSFPGIADPFTTTENLDLTLMGLIIQRKLDRQSRDYHTLQLQINHCIREYDEHMSQKPAPESENPERLQALRVIATIPIVVYLEYMDQNALPIHPADILVHCAAGITACWHMGEDFNSACTCISGYLVLLSDIFTRVEYYRSETAELIAQACLLRTLLASQLEGPQAGIGYYLKALEFGKVAEKTELPSSSPARSMTIRHYGKQPQQVLERIAEAIWLLKPAPPSPDFSLVRDYLYKIISHSHVPDPDSREANPFPERASGAHLKLPKPNDFPATIDYASVALNLWDGVTRYELGEYAYILDSLRPSDVSESVYDAPEIVRSEFLSNRALAALRLHDMDLAITTLRVAFPAALSLSNEEELIEAREAHHLIQFLLPDDPNAPVTALKDLLKKHD